MIDFCKRNLLNMCFEIKKGEMFFFKRFWIVFFNLFNFDFSVVVLWIWVIKIFDILVKEWYNLKNLLLNVVVIFNMKFELFLIFFIKFLILLLVKEMNDDKWVLCCFKVLVIFLVLVFKVFMWFVNILILFMVVVLNIFFDRDLIKGNNVLVCFFFKFGFEGLWFECLKGFD